MAVMTTARGKSRIGVRVYKATSAVLGAYATDLRHVQTFMVDDSSVAFAVGHNALNSGGAIANFVEQVFDGTPAEALVGNNAVVTVTTTLAIGTANFATPHRRYSNHDDTLANTSDSSSTLVFGADGFALTKTGDFSMSIVTKTTFA